MSYISLKTVCWSHRGSVKATRSPSIFQFISGLCICYFHWTKYKNISFPVMLEDNSGNDVFLINSMGTQNFTAFSNCWDSSFTKSLRDRLCKLSMAKEFYPRKAKAQRVYFKRLEYDTFCCKQIIYLYNSLSLKRISRLVKLFSFTDEHYSLYKLAFLWLWYKFLNC